MKATLKPRRPSPEEALAIATSTAPTQPPAQVARASEPPAPLPQSAPTAAERDPSTTLNLRVRMSTIAALEAAAKEKGWTMKQIVMHALKDTGVAVAGADLEDRTPRRGQGRAH
jgi:hypothetical protein